EGEGHHRHLRGQVVQAHADDLVAVEREWPGVRVLAQTLGADQFQEVLDQLFGGPGQLHAEQARRLEEAAEVVEGTEDEELLLLGVPVGPQPGEHSGAVVQPVRHDADPRLRVRDDSTPEERVLRKLHGSSPSAPPGRWTVEESIRREPPTIGIILGLNWPGSNIHFEQSGPGGGSVREQDFLRSLGGWREGAGPAYVRLADAV